jgi:hypothetical protein
MQRLVSIDVHPHLYALLTRFLATSLAPSPVLLRKSPRCAIATSRSPSPLRNSKLGWPQMPQNSNA